MGIRGIKSRVFFQLWILFFISLLFIEILISFIFIDKTIDIFTHFKTQLLEITCEKLISEEIGNGDPKIFKEKAGSLAEDHFLLMQGKYNENIIKKSIQFPKNLETAVYQTLRTGKAITQKDGKTFGFFFYQHESVIITFPVKKGGRIIGAGGIRSSLKGIYKDYRRIQKIVFVFVVINSLFFALIGHHQLSISYFRPLQRLAKRAETYKDETFPFFSVRKEDNELLVLSSSLNKMLNRISDDKHMLNETIGSLETTNIELQKAQNDVIRAEKLATVGRLSSGIAHEIGNPIGIVLGYLDLLKQPDVSEDERADFITRSEKEITRINNIIRQLLDMSRDAAGEVKPVSVHQILEELISVFSYQPTAAGIDFDKSFQAFEEGVIADPDRLRQVFLNLIINAIDAVNIKESGQKRIQLVTDNINGNDDGTLVPKKKYIKVQVIDNGPGFQSTQLTHIFDPFFTTKEPGKGTGLGLSVAFMIVEKLGGQISARNGENIGAIFEVVLSLDQT